MSRKLPNLSTTQLIASAGATTAAAFGASSLGVYGTIIGAGLMSIISTAGAAVGQHYLDQGRDQLKERGHLPAGARRREAPGETGHGEEGPGETGSGERGQGAAREAAAGPDRTAVWSGDPNATRFDPPRGDPNAARFVPPHGDPNATRLDPSLGGDPGATRLDPVTTVADSLAEAAGEDAVRRDARRPAWRNTVEWARAHWVMLAVSSAIVFAIVVGAITIYEAATGKPLGNGGGRGLTVTQVLGGGGGGQAEEAPAPGPTGRPDEPGATPGEAPGVTPTGEAPTAEPTTPGQQRPEQPTGPPTQEPTGRPAPGPTTSVPADPDTPPPTGAPEGGGQDPGAPAPAE